MLSTQVQQPVRRRLGRRAIYVGGPAITWLAYGLLLLP